MVSLQKQTILRYYLPISSDDRTLVVPTRSLMFLGDVPPEFEDDITGSYTDTDIAANIIWQLFGFSEGHSFKRSHGLIEVCSGGPELCVEIDDEDCPYTPESLVVAFGKLTELVNGTYTFHADLPRIANRGTADYPDPVRVEADIDIPVEVTNCLKWRRGHARKHNVQPPTAACKSDKVGCVPAN